MIRPHSNGISKRMESSKVINRRYRKLSGMHAGHSYIVTAPYGEIETPMRWTLHMEGNENEKLIIAENELANIQLWRPLE
jgi:hypothetical protein